MIQAKMSQQLTQSPKSSLNICENLVLGAVMNAHVVCHIYSQQLM